MAHRGGWLKSADNAFEIRGKTLGIVGYGSIGAQLSVLAEALGMHVAFFDVVTKLPLGNARQVRELHQLLAQSDIVTLHVPETQATQWMIGAAEIAAMKPGAILINASRGTVVEIDSLAEALKAKKLLGAAIDVFPVEPRSNKDEFQSPLAGPGQRDPHAAHRRLDHGGAGQHRRWKWRRSWSSTATTAPRRLRSTSRKWRCRRTRASTGCCTSTATCRACCPRSTRSSRTTSINISSQFLQTNEKIGYVVMDIDAASSDLALEKLAKVGGHDPQPRAVLSFLEKGRGAPAGRSAQGRSNRSRGKSPGRRPKIPSPAMGAQRPAEAPHPMNAPTALNTLLAQAAEPVRLREIPYNYTSFSDREMVIRLLGERGWDLLQTACATSAAPADRRRMLYEVLGDIWVVQRNRYLQSTTCWTTRAAAASWSTPCSHRLTEVEKRRTPDSGPAARPAIVGELTGLPRERRRPPSTPPSATLATCAARPTRELGRLTAKDNIKFDGLSRVSHVTDATDWRVEYPFVVPAPRHRG